MKATFGGIEGDWQLQRIQEQRYLIWMCYMATKGMVDNYDPAKVLPIIRSVGNLEIATSTWLLSPLKDHIVIAAKSFAKLYSCRLSQRVRFIINNTTTIRTICKLSKRKLTRDSRY